MSTWQKLKNLDQKFSWSFFGLVFGVLSLGVGVYFGVFYEKKPRLRYEILSSLPVYDVREDIADLEITFKGENIRGQHKMLSLITLKVCNVGNADIVKMHFDENLLPGFSVSCSRIIKAEILGASEDYLKQAAHIKPINETSYSIEPMMIDVEQFFLVKLLVLHDEGRKPTISSINKISGKTKIDVIEEQATTHQVGVVRRVFQGSVAVQIIRVLAYGFGTLIVLGVLAIFSAFLSDSVNTQRRKRYLKRFKEAISRDFTEPEGAVFSRYLDRGETYLVELETQLDDPEELAASLALLDEKADAHPDVSLRGHPAPNVIKYARNQRRRDLEFLISSKLVSRTTNGVIVDTATVETIKKFIVFLMAFVPKRIREIREPYGSESEPIAEAESLTAPDQQDGGPQ